MQAMKSLKDWEKVVEHKLEMALETFSQGQHSAISALHQLYREIQESGQLFNN
jgi:hypothetical protein